MLSSAEMYVNDSTGSFWQYKLFIDIRKHSSDYCRQTGVGWLKSTSLQFSRCYIFISFRNNVDIGLHYDNNPFWVSADTNIDDLERPIHLKVHLVDGMLDVRMLWLLDLTMRDRKVLFPVRSVPRWRPVAILKNSNGRIGISVTHYPLHFMYVHIPYTLPTDAVKTLDTYEIRHLFSKGG